jgi:hypothetical protein
MCLNEQGVNHSGIEFAAEEVECIPEGTAEPPYPYVSSGTVFRAAHDERFSLAIASFIHLSVKPKPQCN